jgi:ATP-binding cassette, subfamily F, member 3
MFPTSTTGFFMEIEKLYKEYGDRTLFSNVTFSIGNRERCAIIGRNGSGKSTLLKIIAGEETADGGEVRTPKRSTIASLPQHLHFTESSILEEAALGLPTDIKDEVYRVERVLSGLGFSEDDFEKEPSTFSGGFQLRLALCKVLVSEPDILLLDEPTNYLDIVAIRWLEKYLRSWHGQVLFVSHDTAFVENVCTHIIGLHRGRIMKSQGGLKKYYEAIQEQELTHERTRDKLDKKRSHIQSFIDRFGAKASKAKQAQSKAKALEKIGSMDEMQKEKDLDFIFKYHDFRSQKMLTASNISFQYREDEPLIHDFSLTVENKQRIAIIGKNGRGKSTILKLLAGEIKNDDGEIISSANSKIAYFGQTNIDRLDHSKTIEEEIQDALPDAPYGAIRAACGAMLFPGDDAKKPISVLSGGERSRVLLAKLLLTPANLLLLDEPTHHLDIESVASLMDAIEVFPGAVILVTHDETTLNQLCADNVVICTATHQEMILGDYATFLEKKGWDDEGKKPKKKEKKNNKQDKALLIQERGKLLRPIQNKMKKLEEKICTLEKEKEELEVKMTKEPDAIGFHLKSHDILTKDLDKNYSVLQDLMEQEDKIEDKFSL